MLYFKLHLKTIGRLVTYAFTLDKCCYAVLFTKGVFVDKQQSSESTCLTMRSFVSLSLIQLNNGQNLAYVNLRNESLGICRDFYSNNMAHLRRLERCIVVVGNLHIVLIEKTNVQDFRNITFPNLREVTGYLLMYRVKGLQSLGQLLPNLSRIGGNELLGNYALIIYDMESLKEIGLYNLVKIDRGAVMVKSCPLACYLRTIDWKMIAPKARHVINPIVKHFSCPKSCNCSKDPTENYCWNNKKCQRFVLSQTDLCHEQCYGCIKGSNSSCFLCRHYTFGGHCVDSCPKNTLVLRGYRYCITKQECLNLYGWEWNNTCVFQCPANFIFLTTNGTGGCSACKNCTQTCETQYITTLESVQNAGKCKIINGSLEIYLRDVPDAMQELNQYLRQIEQVTDYIYIYSSLTITSLNFLSSLKRINGRNLKNDRYSLIIKEMHVLRSLFTEKTLNNLVINRGTAKILKNPNLCSNEIENVLKLFPEAPSEIDIPLGMNGYSGNCKEDSVLLQVEVVSETSALVTLTPQNVTDLLHMEYNILYAKLPVGKEIAVEPGICSDSEWLVIGVILIPEANTTVEIKGLKPASSYALCIESYDTLRKNLARSSLIHIRTLVGKPAPPFLTELVATSENTAVIHWLDHLDYSEHISHYELDVMIIEINVNDIAVKNHCKDNDIRMFDLSRHVVVMKPPPEYRTCETMCAISSESEKAMIQDDIDICEILGQNYGCDYEEYLVEGNSTIGNYVRTLKLRIDGKNNQFEINKLAPFRDYRVRLRACTNSYCSQSSRGVVRTLPSNQADFVTSTTVEETGYGELAIKWEYPTISNGPILAFVVQVVPQKDDLQMGYIVPQTWCISNNETNINVPIQKAKTYYVRICVSSLMSQRTCVKWIVNKPQASGALYWYLGALCGIFFWIVPIIVICMCMRRPTVVLEDEIILIENTHFD